MKILKRIHTVNIIHALKGTEKLYPLVKSNKNQTIHKISILSILQTFETNMKFKYTLFTERNAYCFLVHNDHQGQLSYYLREKLIFVVAKKF